MHPKKKEVVVVDSAEDGLVQDTDARFEEMDDIMNQMGLNDNDDDDDDIGNFHNGNDNIDDDDDEIDLT